MGEGPLKTGLLKTAEFLKAAGVRETTLPPMDMSRISEPTVRVADVSGLVPALESAYGWGGALTPTAVFNSAVEIEVGAGGMWIEDFHWEVGGANGNYGWFVYGPEATRMTAGFTVAPWVDCGALSIESRLLVGEIDPATAPVPANFPRSARNMSLTKGGFFLSAGKRLLIFSFPSPLLVMGGWVSVREVPST